MIYAPVVFYIFKLIVGMHILAEIQNLTEHTMTAISFDLVTIQVSKEKVNKAYKRTSGLWSVRGKMLRKGDEVIIQIIGVQDFQGVVKVEGEMMDLTSTGPLPILIIEGKKIEEEKMKAAAELAKINAKKRKREEKKRKKIE